jgi:hypothetical protein
MDIAKFLYDEQEAIIEDEALYNSSLKSVTC